MKNRNKEKSRRNGIVFLFENIYKTMECAGEIRL